MKYLVCLLAAVLLAVLPVAAKDQLSINGNFQRVNTGTSATNVPGVNFDVAIGNGKARVTLTCTNVTSNTNFQFLVGSNWQATFTGNVRHKANLFFKNYSTNHAQPLEFDPRDQVLTIFDGKTNLLTLTIGTNNQSTNVSYHESVDLAAVASVGAAEASYDQTKTNIRSFRVTLEKVSPGTYDVFVDGALRGSITVKSSQGRILFEYPYGRNDLPMLFDPRGKSVQVFREGVLQFDGILRTPLILSPGP